MTEKIAKPQLRFAGFDDTWEQRKLGEVATEMVAGGDIDKDLILDEGRYPVIANALTNDGIVGYYNEDYRIKAPAVTITGRGDVGHAKARIVHFTPVVRLLSLKSNHDVFFLENAINTLKIVIESTGVPQLTVPQLAKYEISFPKSLDEEEKIGAYFKHLDNLVTLHQRKYDKLTNVKKSMLEKMFPKNGSNVPEIRFKGFSDAWEQRKLGELTSLITKGTTPLDKSNIGTVNFVKIESIDNSSGEITITQKISSEEHEGYLRRSQLKENDILFSIAGTLGRVTSVKSSILPANTNQALAIIRLKSGCLKYVKTYLKGKAVADFIKKNPTIGAQPNLSLEQVSNLDIALPSEIEQEQIGAFFEQLDNLITLHQRELEKLKNLKKACLEKMFV